MSLPPTFGSHSCAQWPVIVDPVFLCWLWQNGLTPQGYAIGDAGADAHRQVYKAEVGPIPDGMFLDHWCRRRACVNPAHLEPVTQSVNEKRKRWAYRVKLKKCQHGHDLFEYGRRTPEGGKICIACG